MARVLRAIGNQTYVIVPVLVPAKIHPLDLLRLLAHSFAPCSFSFAVKAFAFSMLAFSSSGEAYACL